MSSLAGTWNSFALAVEHASRRCVKSQIKCTLRGLSQTSCASTRSAAESSRAPTIASTFARSAGSIACRPDSHREMVDWATPSNPAACSCFTRCSKRQRRSAAPSASAGRLVAAVLISRKFSTGQPTGDAPRGHPGSMRARAAESRHLLATMCCRMQSIPSAALELALSFSTSGVCSAPPHESHPLLPPGGRRLVQ